ncbi:hypothetical protein RRG08_045809 [Elysia crispata]|uniref:Uncharacterized protein n=1 Tax=Elysia crispata TaxID=231223 RepID=A0AAE1D6S8_9GAST|nr:hypothetical protein RRG08_045809 [Elysia crispata]
MPCWLSSQIPSTRKPNRLGIFNSVNQRVHCSFVFPEPGRVYPTPWLTQTTNDSGEEGILNVEFTGAAGVLTCFLRTDLRLAKTLEDSGAWIPWADVTRPRLTRPCFLNCIVY